LAAPAREGKGGLSAGILYRKSEAKDSLRIAVTDDGLTGIADYIDEHISADQTAYGNIQIPSACIRSIQGQYRLPRFPK